MKKNILQYILRIITIKIIKKYNPKIIAITGSVGKTSTKDAIYTVLSNKIKARKSSGNLNSEVGAPLVFIGFNKTPKNIKDWTVIILKGIFLIFLKDKNYPKLIISELAADKPGDISYLVGFIKPNIGIITAVGDTPVHIKFYKNSEELAKEKSNIFSFFSALNTAIINRDDAHYNTIKNSINSSSQIITFGFNKDADVCITNFSITSNRTASVKLKYKKNEYSIILNNCLDESFAYISAIVFATLIALKLNLNEFINEISKIRPSLGRLNLIKGINNSLILDGSYNAAPLSMKSALHTLSRIGGKRKIGVIGDMLELGSYEEKEHQKIGELAGSFCDFIFAVGKNSQIIKKHALLSKINKKNTFAFSKSEEIIPLLKKIIKPGDIILIKGSQGVRTEKIVYAIMKNKTKASKTLVRQSNFWKR